MDHMIISVIDCSRTTDVLYGQTPALYFKELVDQCGISAQYERALDIESFRAAIDRSLFRSVSLEQWPVIHIDGHGNANGIGLPDGDFIRWGKLAAILEPTLEAYDGAVILCISTCNGLYGARMAGIEALDASFMAVVGSLERIYQESAAYAYLAFVTHLKDGSPPRACLDAMNACYREPVFDILAGNARFRRSRVA